MDLKEKKCKSSIAIKKIEKAFEHIIYTKRTLRELKMQRILQHDNVFFLIKKKDLKFKKYLITRKPW